MPTETSATVGAATAHHHRHINPASHREPGAQAAPRETEPDCLAHHDAHRAVIRQWLAADLRLEVRPAPRHQSVAVKTQLRAGLRHLEHRGIVLVAHDEVCRARGEGVERAANHDAVLLVTGPAEILHCREQAGLEHMDHGLASSWSNSPGVMTRNFT